MKRTECAAKLDTLKALYGEACAARDAAHDTPSWDYLDRRCSKLAREIDEFIRGRANAIQAGERGIIYMTTFAFSSKIFARKGQST